MGILATRFGSENEAGSTGVLPLQRPRLFRPLQGIQQCLELQEEQWKLLDPDDGSSMVMWPAHPAFLDTCE